jgi:cyclophilin family peptidyl-prolyl cis-trans isomerase
MAATPSDSIQEIADPTGGMHSGIERWRVPVLAGLALVVVGSLGLLAYGSVKREKIDTLRSEMDAIVDDFSGRRSLYSYSGAEAQPNLEVAEEQVKKLEELRVRAAGTEVEPLILLQIAIRHQVLSHDAQAIAAIEEIRKGHPDAPILKVQSFDSERDSLADRIAKVSKRRMEFAALHVYVEPKADPARYAIVETDLGTMKLLFFRDLAPKHIEAFIAQAKSGGFNGTRLYTARRGDWIELGGGDRTRNAELRDDTEDDPAVSLAPEDAARYGVKHRRRMITSVPMLSGDQGDRFAVVLAAAKPEFDALRTPFGELLDDDSAAVADRLGSTLTFGEDATYIDRKEKTDFPNAPSRPVLVRRVSIWKEGALEPGHAWDTARVNTDQPEPSKTETPEEPKKDEQKKDEEKAK